MDEDSVSYMTSTHAHTHTLYTHTHAHIQPEKEYNKQSMVSPNTDVPQNMDWVASVMVLSTSKNILIWLAKCRIAASLESRRRQSCGSQ